MGNLLRNYDDTIRILQADIWDKLETSYCGLMRAECAKRRTRAKYELAKYLPREGEVAYELALTEVKSLKYEYLL